MTHDPERSTPTMADLAALTAAVEAGNRKDAAALTQAALDDGTDPKTILDAMTAAMDVVGKKFQEGELYVPEMLIAARAMKAGTSSPSSRPRAWCPSSARSWARWRGTSTTSARTWWA
jgi:methanogenic corrinoid protein MtbC1